MAAHGILGAQGKETLYRMEHGELGVKSGRLGGPKPATTRARQSRG